MIKNRRHVIANCLSSEGTGVSTMTVAMTTDLMRSFVAVSAARMKAVSFSCIVASVFWRFSYLPDSTPTTNSAHLSTAKQTSLDAFKVQMHRA